MEKTDSNYGITVSKKLLDSKHTMIYIPMHHGYWNCIVWAVRRLTPVINPTLAEYYPFEKYAFPLLHPVLHELHSSVWKIQIGLRVKCQTLLSSV